MHDTYSMIPLLIIDTASPHFLLNFSYFFNFLLISYMLSYIVLLSLSFPNTKVRVTIF